MAKLKITNRYGIIPNDLLNNKTLSRKAKWLFWYLQSKPEDRDFAIDRIRNDASDGRDSTTNGIKELEQAWYLQRTKWKNDKWQRDIEYTLYDTPITGNPTWINKKTITDNPTSDNPTSENTETNKERNSNKELQIKNTSKEVQQSWQPPVEWWEEMREEDSTQLSVKKEKAHRTLATPTKKDKPDNQQQQQEIKKKCDQLGLAYESDKDTYFAKHILDAKEFWAFAEKIGKTRAQMAISIVSASVQINYRKWATAWPRRIYKEYQEIYNLWITKYKKESEKKPLYSIWKLC